MQTRSVNRSRISERAIDALIVVAKFGELHPRLLGPLSGVCRGLRGEFYEQIECSACWTSLSGGIWSFQKVFLLDWVFPNLDSESEMRGFDNVIQSVVSLYTCLEEKCNDPDPTKYEGISPVVLPVSSPTMREILVDLPISFPRSLAGWPCLREVTVSTSWLPWEGRPFEGSELVTSILESLSSAPVLERVEIFLSEGEASWELLTKVADLCDNDHVKKLVIDMNLQCGDDLICHEYLYPDTVMKDLARRHGISGSNKIQFNGTVLLIGTEGCESWFTAN